MTTTAAETLAVSTVIDLATSTVAQWDTVEGLKVVEMDDHCNYCGGQDIPMVDTRTGRTALPHRRDAKDSACVYGTLVAPATVENTSRLL